MNILVSTFPIEVNQHFVGALLTRFFDFNPMLTKPHKTYVTTGNLKKNGERCFSAAVGVRCLSTDQSSGLDTKRTEIFRYNKPASKFRSSWNRDFQS